MTSERGGSTGPEGYWIGLAKPEHVAPMPDVELRAARLFAPYGLPQHVLDDATSLAAVARHQEQASYYAATDSAGTLVGYALLETLDDRAHLGELGVDPDHGRRGLGKALVEASCGWASERGSPVLTLTTYRDVPFNAPWYATLGFEVVSEAVLGHEMRERVEEEAEEGLVPPERVVMSRRL